MTPRTSMRLMARRSAALSSTALLAAVSLTALLALDGCQKKDADAEKKAEAKAKAAASAEANDDDDEPKPRKAPPAEEGIDVPTEEDFEEAVASQITPETDLKKELDQLEKEIAQ